MNRSSAPRAWSAFPCSDPQLGRSPIRVMSIWRFDWTATFRGADLTISAGWKISSSTYPNCSAAVWTLLRSRSARSASKGRSIGIAPLPSEKPARRLEDIIENARAALQYTADMDEAAFERNRLVYDAVERC